MTPPPQPASTCFGCSRQGIVSEDQAGLHGRPGGNSANPMMRFYCVCGRVWAVARETAELQGRFLDRSGLRKRATPTEKAGVDTERLVQAPEATSRTMRAVLDALADEVAGKTAPPPEEPPAETTPLQDWRLRELADVSLQLQGELDPHERRQLLQRWADLTLLLGSTL